MRHVSLIVYIAVLALSSCLPTETQQQTRGVSLQLAQERFDDISDVQYHLELTIPDSALYDIHGKSTISFLKKKPDTPLVLDFVCTANQIKKVLVNDVMALYRLENEHLVIPSSVVQQGANKIEISFVLGNGALNRSDSHFYSLFVPARARTAMPCFDQPDIKARISYTIDMPKNMTAITNGLPYYSEQLAQDRKREHFEMTKPISSYLWAFAVGEFDKITEERNGMEISIYHMEKDSLKIARSASAVFDQVFHSIQWLEEYTEVDFPFNKYDLVCIPSFQFAGMEHPGAVYYRSELLFLDSNPTQSQLLRRAQLLAHETAHMWFGDLVTMKWFGGVWQKEVFANFIADKIVEEQRPELNHKLTFLTNHFPAAYSVDRTIGANPIQQALDNLNDAGSMYGNIIYHKAPVMMQQLENLVGEEKLRKGLSTYLKIYGYSNASWENLMSILSDLSEYDLELWSRTWVHEPGRPVFNFSFKDGAFQIQQRAEHGDSTKVWAQRINLCRMNGSKKIREEVEILSEKTVLNGIIERPDYIFPTVDETGYGLFAMDDKSLKYALDNLYLCEDVLCKGSMLVQLYENLLDGKINPIAYLNMLKNFIVNEHDEQVLALACNQLTNVYWRFTPANLRAEQSEALESTLWDKMEDLSILGTKKLLFNTWSDVLISSSGLETLDRIIKEGRVCGVQLAEIDLSVAACNLVLKDDSLDNSYLISFAHTLKDDELSRKILFMSQVFSHDQAVLDRFVTSLAQRETRSKENWVLAAISYLHHPYREEGAIKYLNDALGLTQSIKETGDIFFPIGWLNNTLSGYGSDEAIKIIDLFIDNNPQYPEDLKLKLLQSADMVERSRMVKERYLR